jgi:class 3 adenylate cyclase/tetratricopeptide (TPR) repeat protein
LTPPSTAREGPNSPLTIPGVDEAPEVVGERKTVTALFVDIKGSTELAQNLDPEEVRAIIDPALRMMIEAVHRYDGYVVQSTGDGIFAMFGAPLAHEDHPQRALYAALRMLENLRRASATPREHGGAPIEIRVGVNTGEVVVRTIQTAEERAEYTPIGHTTNLASRIQTVAAPGTVATTEDTRKLCEGYFTFRLLGPMKVKGVSEAVNVHEVTGLGPLRTRLQASMRRGLSRFVGRDAEVALTTRALASAQAGRGQIVAAVGEAGVGKSRLFYEFQRIGLSGSLVLETLSVAHGKASPFLPLVELLENYFDITSEEDVRKRRETIRSKVLILDHVLEDTLPYIFTLLELAEGDDPLAQMDPETRRHRTLDAIKRLLLRESLNQPLILVFEDLHWFDEGSLAFLKLLVDSIYAARVLMLVTYRPEFTHPWGDKSYYMQLRVDPLGGERAEEMLSALLGDGPDLAPLKRVIVEKTEGNPFFMEEIVRALFEQGALVRDGAVKLSMSLGTIRIPPTVHAVLASRIDRLPPDEKDLLNTLAVIGKEFPLKLVRPVAEKSDDELQRMLANLQAAEFIYEQPAFPDVAYAFKHALSQQVAYGSALRERRKLLHKRIARVLEAHFLQTADTQPELIAHHYTEAGLDAEAIPLWQRAAERALARAANQEAISQATRALELLASLQNTPKRSGQMPSDESRHCTLLLTLGQARKYLGENLKALQAFEQAADTANALGSADLLVRSALALAMMSAEWGTPAASAVRWLENALQALGTDDGALKVKTLSGLGRALAATGEHQKATNAAMQALALARSLDDPEILAEGLSGTLFALQGPEHTEQRRAYATELVQLARATSAQKRSAYSHDLSCAHWSLLYCFLELGDMPALDAEIDAYGRTVEKAQAPFGIMLAIGYRAMRALMEGRFKDSEDFAQQASAIGQRLQSENSAGVFALQMFTIRREQGRLRELEPVVRHFVRQNTEAAAWRPGLAVIYSELGHRQEASEQFEHLAEHDFADLPRDALWMASMTYLTDVCTFLEDRLRAATLYQLLLPYDGRTVVIGNATACYGALSRYLGALATTLGRWDDAARHFQDAMTMNARMEALPWLAHTQCQYAFMLIARDQAGDRDQAAGLLNAALVTARQLGMRALEERLTAKMTALMPNLH